MSLFSKKLLKVKIISVSPQKLMPSLAYATPCHHVSWNSDW